MGNGRAAAEGSQQWGSRSARALVRLPGLMDLVAGVAHWRLWIRLAMRDVRMRYRRTVLGPFWAVLSNALMIGTLGFIYSYFWGLDIDEFLPYFSAGYITWVTFLITTTESAQAFISAETVIKSFRIPYSVHVFRVILRNIVIFFHMLILHIAIMLIFGVSINLYSIVMFFIGLCLFAANGIWIGLLVAIVSARFRDFIQLTQSLLQVAFFLTPIFWPVEQLDGHPLVKAAVADFNPIYHLIEIVRAPLLGRAPAIESFVALVFILLLGSAVTVAIFNRFRRRIAFWI